MAAGDRIAHLTLINNTSYTLTKPNSSLEHGIWNGDGQPPLTIKPNSSGSWGSSADGFMTGTSGSVSYQIDNDPNKLLSLSWDIPFAGTNSYGQTAACGLIQEDPHFTGSGNEAWMHWIFSNS